MKLPGFTAEASLYKTGVDSAAQVYRGKSVFGGAGAEIVPELRFSSDPDLGAYWRCRLNGGSDLICRFFGGLPPFTIGGRLF